MQSLKYRPFYIAGCLAVILVFCISSGIYLVGISAIIFAVCAVFMCIRPASGIAIMLSCSIVFIFTIQYRERIDSANNSIGTTQKISATALLLSDTWFLVTPDGKLLRHINSDIELEHMQSYTLDFEITNISTGYTEMLLSSGITFFGTAKNLAYTQTPLHIPPMANAAATIDSLLKKIVTSMNSSFKGITLALLFSEKAYTQDNILELMRYTGIYHLTSVSGVHISILLSMLSTIIPILRRYAILRLVVFIFLGSIIFLLAGCAASAFRAVSIACIQCIAEVFLSDNDALNTTGLSLILIMCISPWAVLSLGFYMSYGIYMCIAIFSTKISLGIENLLKNILKLKKSFGYIHNISNILSINLICSGAAAIFSFFIFGAISPYSIIISMLTAPFITPLLIFGYIGVGVFYLGFQNIGIILISIANFMSGVIYKITELMSKLDGIYIDIYSMSGFICSIALIVIILAICAIPTIFSKKTILSSSLSGLLVCIYICICTIYKPALRIILPHGSSTLLINYEKNTLLINADTGDSEYSAAQILKNLSHSTLSGIYDIRYMRSYYENIRQVRNFNTDAENIIKPLYSPRNVHKFNGFTISEQGKNHSKLSIAGKNFIFLYGNYGENIANTADRLLFEPYDLLFTQTGSVLLTNSTKILYLPHATVIEA